VSYLLLKSVHYYLALLSLAGFMMRGIWMLSDSALLQHRLTKTVPHIVDTLFLVAGLMLAYRIFQYPFTHDWLTAKLFGLIAYILLGTIALKRGKSRRIRQAAFFSAILVFSWIISVAMSKSPWGYVGILVG
jgi:uncharacterized membrane protein SirB2